MEWDAALHRTTEGSTSHPETSSCLTIGLNTPVKQKVTLVDPRWSTLLAIIAHTAVQSSERDTIHNAMLLRDTSINAWYNKAYSLIEKSYLAIIASNARMHLIWTKCASISMGFPESFHKYRLAPSPWGWRPLPEEILDPSLSGNWEVLTYLDQQLDLLPNMTF